jgi:hypothetical protein
VTDTERIAALEERVAACEEYIQVWLILEDAKRRARDRANGDHLHLVDDT